MRDVDVGLCVCVLYHLFLTPIANARAKNTHNQPQGRVVLEVVIAVVVRRT